MNNSRFLSKKFWFYALFLTHLLGVLFYFGIIHTINPRPIYNHDYPYHLYQGWESKPMILRGYSWGYDPFFMAGFIHGTTLDNDLVSLVAAFLPLQGQIYLIKIWVTFVLLSLPLFIFLSSRNFGLDEWTSFVCAIILLIYLYNDYFVNSTVFYGMYNFLFGNIFSLFNLSLFYSYFSYAKTKILLLLCITLPILLLVHTAVWLIFFIPWIILYLACFKRLSIQQHILVLGLVMGSVLLIFFWLFLPFKVHILPYMSELNVAREIFQINNIEQIFQDFLYKPSSTHEHLQIIKTIIIILGIVGFKRLAKDKPLKIMLGISSLLFFVLSFFHNMLPFPFLSLLQPYKFIISLVFFLTIPCGKLLKESLSLPKIVRRRLFVKFIYVIILFTLVGSIIYIHALAPTQHALFTTPPQDLIEIESWIKQHTTMENRIMVESSLPVESLFDKPSFAYGILVINTGRQLLGWAHWTCVLSNNFPSITENKIFGKDLSSVQEKELADYLELYNVGWIIARSNNAKKYLYNIYRNGNLFEDLHTIGFIKGKEKLWRFTIFKVKNNPNFIFGGNADVSVEMNRISIKNLRIQDKDIILKYHWHPTLRSTHGLRLEPVYLMDAPVPFIKVRNVNTPEFDIYNSYNAK